MQFNSFNWCWKRVWSSLCRGELHESILYSRAQILLATFSKFIYVYIYFSFLKSATQRQLMWFRYSKHWRLWDISCISISIIVTALSLKNVSPCPYNKRQMSLNNAFLYCSLTDTENDKMMKISQGRGQKLYFQETPRKYMLIIVR